MKLAKVVIHNFMRDAVLVSLFFCEKEIVKPRKQKLFKTYIYKILIYSLIYCIIRVGRRFK